MKFRKKILTNFRWESRSQVDIQTPAENCQWSPFSRGLCQGCSDPWCSYRSRRCSAPGTNDTWYTFYPDLTSSTTCPRRPSWKPWTGSLRTWMRPVQGTPGCGVVSWQKLDKSGFENRPEMRVLRRSFPVESNGPGFRPSPERARNRGSICK